jgi:hypothetical protein
VWHKLLQAMTSHLDKNFMQVAGVGWAPTSLRLTLSDPLAKDCVVLTRRTVESLPGAVHRTPDQMVASRLMLHLRFLYVIHRLINSSNVPVRLKLLQGCMGYRVCLNGNHCQCSQP